MKKLILFFYFFIFICGIAKAQESIAYGYEKCSVNAIVEDLLQSYFNVTNPTDFTAGIGSGTFDESYTYRSSLMKKIRANAVEKGLKLTSNYDTRLEGTITIISGYKQNMFVTLAIKDTFEDMNLSLVATDRFYGDLEELFKEYQIGKSFKMNNGKEIRVVSKKPIRKGDDRLSFSIKQ